MYKVYYDVLDGLRGTAAIVILVFHYLEMIYPDDYSENFLGHGFLAVDFFFCLSDIPGNQFVTRFNIGI